jgi:Na+/H+ antiporter NhaD/arsenite permease-like protein
MASSPSLWQELSAAATADPFLPVASAIFLLAIVHTFLAPWFAGMAHKLDLAHAERVRQGKAAVNAEGKSAGFRASLLHFLGEIEAIFGIWAFFLFYAFVFWPGKGWDFATAYMETADYALATKIASEQAVQGVRILASPKYLEPLFVFVIMAIASSRPIFSTASRLLNNLARFLGGTPMMRWAVVLIVAPLLGSLITEPAAMTIAALMISAQFHELKPSMRLRYATLGLLFVNVSIGGTLTHFAAPPVVMVAGVWGWTTPHMFLHFGFKAVLAILFSTIIYGLLFRKEFAELARRADPPLHPESEAKVPSWVVGAHLVCMAWTVLMLIGHHGALLMAGLLVFLAFTVATPQWQSPIQLRGPLLVAFFLASLVLHGGLQSWWISPILTRLGELELFAGATILTAFNDNAAITYLAAQVPALSDGSETARALQFAVLAGAVTGGGLTVIANAPNPAGLSILARHFGDGVSPVKLFLWALIPTLVSAAFFILLPR